MKTPQHSPRALPASPAPEPATKSVEELQREFNEAFATLAAIHAQLTRAQWLRDYDKAPG
ncbi:MAG: hypothetical protein I8H71_00875 [Xanthomonadaceae bacterium]|nr:hypothetical protein [Xanthomonadaceae bacterium]